MNVHSITEIPLVDLAAQQAEIHDELWPILEDIFRRAAFIGGPEVDAFERMYAQALSVAHCVGVANGTDALELALRAVNVLSGDEVILPANTFIATAEAVARIGATPVLVDVDPRYLLIDPDEVAAKISSRTRAIIPVHLFGQTAPVEDLLRIAEGRGIPIVEDAAQAQGAQRRGRPAGSLGTIAATSFYPGKNLGASGDAGAVLTNDPLLAERVRLLSSHGSRTKYVHEVMGSNSRLDAVQAAVLRTKLKYLEEWNQRRRMAAAYYRTLLADYGAIELPECAQGNEDVWHLYVVRVPDRDRILKELNSHGIQAGVHYPVPVNLSEAWAVSGHASGHFPVAEAAAGRILSLPLFPHITAAQQERVAEVLIEAVEGGAE